MKKVDQVSADMRLIRGAISASRDLELFFASPVIDRSKKKGVIKALFEAKVDKLTMGITNIQNPRELKFKIQISGVAQL